MLDRRQSFEPTIVRGRSVEERPLQVWLVSLEPQLSAKCKLCEVLVRLRLQAFFEFRFVLKERFAPIIENLNEDLSL